MLGRHGEPHLRLVAVEGLSAEGDPRPRLPFGGG